MADGLGMRVDQLFPHFVRYLICGDVRVTLQQVLGNCLIIDVTDQYKVLYIKVIGNTHGVHNLSCDQGFHGNQERCGNTVGGKDINRVPRACADIIARLGDNRVADIDRIGIARCRGHGEFRGFVGVRISLAVGADFLGQTVFAIVGVKVGSCGNRLEFVHGNGVSAGNRKGGEELLVV